MKNTKRVIHPMKPETIARRAAEHQAASIARRIALRASFVEKVERDGPDSIWAEMLVEMDARNAA